MSSDLAPTFLPGDPVCDALFEGRVALKNRDKQFSERAIDPLRGHFSNDRKYLSFKHNASLMLTKEFPETVDEYGRVSGNGVRSNFYGMRHVNGFPMLPATYPVTSNEELRRQKGLVNEITTDWHETVLRMIVRLMFTGLEPEPMRLRKNSSSMMPYYVKDMSDKQMIASLSLESAEKAGNMMLKGDYTTPWVDYQIGGANHTVYRRQSTDGVKLEKGVFTSKERPVADLEFAISGGRKGTFLPASKELKDVDFHVPPGFFRERNRTAKGAPLGMNATLMPIAQALRTHIYKDFAYTYHHTTRDSIQSDVRELMFTIAADVSNHDWYWPHFILPIIADELRSIGYADWWVELYLTKARLPDYVTDVGPGLGNILLGDWRKPANTGGLSSGNAFTDIEGTILMTWVYFIIQVEHTYDELIPQLKSALTAAPIVDRYLRGQLPIRLKDKSDDAILGWADRLLVPRAQKLLQKMQAGEQVSPYMIVTYEHGGAFLGSIIQYPGSKDPSGVVLIGNILSYVNNMFSPEYGVQSDLRDRTRAKRPFPGLAWKTMSQNYGSCPIYGEVRERIEYIWTREYGYSYFAFRDDWLHDDERALRDHLEHASIKGLPDLSVMDVEVLIDPSKAEWKYDKKDLSPQIADLLFNGIGLDLVEPYFERVFS